MKFELVEPPEDIGEGAVSELPYPVPADEDVKDQVPLVFHEGRDDVLIRPVRQRMAKGIDGVRASLDRLRAHVTQQSMAEAHRAAATAPEAAPGAVFHAHRFSGSGSGSGQEGAR